MKNIKDYISEGVLNDVDSSINNMDSALAIAEKDRLYKLFPTDIHNRGKHSVAVINHGVYYGGRVLETFIEECCTLSDNVLTIDLSKRNVTDLTINLFAKNIVKEGILIKVLDHPQREHIDNIANIVEGGNIWPTVNVFGDDYEIDLSKVLHKDSKIEVLKIGDDAWSKIKTTFLKDSNIPCTVLGYVEYCCNIKKITKFPDRILLPKPLYKDIILKALKLNNADTIFGFNGALAISK